MEKHTKTVREAATGRAEERVVVRQDPKSKEQECAPKGGGALKMEGRAGGVVGGWVGKPSFSGLLQMTDVIFCECGRIPGCRACTRCQSSEAMTLR